MVIRIEDPSDELKNRRAQIEKKAASLSVIDDKEMKEREDAADAYASENEQHFVDYGMDCIKQSVKANEEVRQVQAYCWHVYNEKEPGSYADKEPWQSRTIVPKPFNTVQFATAAVRKAFSPNFLSIENTKNKEDGDFWQKLMSHQLNNKHANFTLKFTDADVMALAIGVSMEMIPRWIPNKGLEYSLVEPWKIHREPDALSRDCQSGMYWIHQEWLDYFVLKDGEKKNRYFDVARVKDVGDTDPANPFMTKEAIAARKEQIWERSEFRKMILTSEFWGIVLDPQGEMLLPRAKYTFAGGRVIQKPKASPYKTLRWPGISFSPLPDILKFGGRGLLEGVLTIWEAMCNIMCMHEDYLKWVVDPPTEINVDGLVDPNDADLHPGMKYLTRDTVHGNQVVRVVQRRSRTNDVLANSQHYDQMFQRGSNVSDAVQGLPGYRKDITFREASMNLDQAMGVFGLMGENTEDGAVTAVSAGAEIVETHAGIADLDDIFTEEDLKKYGVEMDPTSKSGVRMPKLDGSFHISGIQALMKDNETLINLKEIIIPLSEKPRYALYIKPFKILKAVERRANLMDEEVIATEDEAKMIDIQQRLVQAKQMDAAEKLQDLQEAMGITELIEKVQEIESQGGDIKEIAARIQGLEAGKEGMKAED